MTNPSKVVGRARLPAPPRDRRPALAALALLLVVAGALGSALIAYRSGHRVDVLIVERDIAPGHKMAESDFGVARVAADSGSVVKAGARRNFVGSYSTGRIPSGTLVNRTMFRVGGVIPNGAVQVGVTLTASQRPAQQLQIGDVVRSYLVPKSTSGPAAATGQVLVGAARILDVQTGSSAENDVTVSLLVSQDDAKAILPAATAGQVAVALLPDATVPPVDLLTS